MIPRFFRRIFETGAVFFFGLAGLLALGFRMALTTPNELIQPTSLRSGQSPTDSHAAAYLWLLCSIVCLILGLTTFFNRREK